ncbi:MAG TPA: hypothetical protein VEG08_05020 [Terriglobales bacterium]|nr:hypothetical protein [Terriglobales bacterium]
MGIRTIATCILVCFLALLTLAAEIWVYVLLGMGATKGVTVGAVLLIGLMIITAAVAIVVPASAMVGALMKKPKGSSYFILLPWPPFLFAGKRK